MNLKNRKAQDFLTGKIIFLILNLLFFSIMFLFVSRVGSGAELFENKESRIISLAIDEMRDGTELSISLEDAYNLAEKNHFSGNIVLPDYAAGKITVSVVAGGGGGSYYFRKLNPGSISLDPTNKILVIKC